MGPGVELVSSWILVGFVTTEPQQDFLKSSLCILDTSLLSNMICSFPVLCTVFIFLMVSFEAQILNFGVSLLVQGVKDLTLSLLWLGVQSLAQ